MKINFFMQKVNGMSSTTKDLESDFPGLRYVEATGLEARGKRKNVYTESYADSDELRVWQGDEVAREATDIKIKFIFIGSNRQKALDDFYNFVKNGKIYYWDTKRLKKAFLFLQDNVEVSEDQYKEGVPYKIVSFQFKNIWGECKSCSPSGGV